MPYTIWETLDKYEHYVEGNDGKIIFLPHKTETSDREPTIQYYIIQLKVNMKKTLCTYT